MARSSGSEAEILKTVQEIKEIVLDLQSRQKASESRQVEIKKDIAEVEVPAAAPSTSPPEDAGGFASSYQKS
jgi:hypothetical protein